MASYNGAVTRKRKNACNGILAIETQTKSVPTDCVDDEVAIIYLKQQFCSRFGPDSPDFYPGSLLGAMNKARRRCDDNESLLAIYLHHDGSRHVDEFCLRMLCNRHCLEILDQDYVIWAWDVTESKNKERFILQVSTLFNSDFLYDISRAAKDKFPMLIVVRCGKERCVMLNILEGDSSYEHFISSLKRQSLRAREKRRIVQENEKQRGIRNKLLDDQKKEYAQSLEIDQKKEKMREERNKLAEIRRRSDEKMNRINRESQKKRQREIQEIKKKLPREPSTSKNVLTVKFRSPEGDSCLSRRFLKQDKLAILLNFVTSEGFSLKDHTVISLCPRKDISSLNRCQTLHQLGFATQEMLIIERKE